MSQKEKHIDNRHRLDEQTEKLLAQLLVPANRSKEEIWESLGSVKDSGKVHPSRRLMYATWAAACLVVLLSVGTFMAAYTTRVECPRGQHVEVMLPDGSNVLLNSESQISYKKYWWWKKREVKLAGEAFFKVKKGKRFDVVSKGYVTSVLGTSFNVFARDNQVKVSCFTGRVGVKEIKTGNEAILTPGLGVSAKGNILGCVHKVAESAKGWTSGEFYFSNAPLKDVFAEVERQFNVKISASGIENRRYTGYFSSRDLKLSLELVCVPMQLGYKITSGNEVIVSPFN